MCLRLPRPAICRNSRKALKFSYTMKENKTNDTTCTPCEQKFERNVKEIVKEGKKPTTMAHEKRREEVKAAFSDKKKK